MKIAFVFDNMIYGGIEKVGISYIKLLKKMGHEVDAYVLNCKTDNIVDNLKKICNVKLVNFSRYCCPEAYWALTRRKRIGMYVFPFVYIVVSLLSFFSKIFKTQLKKYDISIAFAGHFNDLTFVANNFIRAKSKICWLHGALYQYVLISQGYERLYKKIKNLVVLVDEGQDEVLSYHNKDKFNFNIRKIYNPVLLADKCIDKSKIETLKKSYGEFILMVSRLSYPHKDHYTVIKAISILKEKYHIEKNLLLLGEGPECERLKDFVKQNKLDNQVNFLGNCEDVQNYYCSAKILVHASVAGEGLPTVLLEAMSYGLPVISTDSKVGPKEIIGNNEYGILTKIKDPYDMAEKIYTLLINDELYETYKELGKKRIEDFSPDNIYEKLNALLKEVD